jgi:hypothetical protein
MPECFDRINLACLVLGITNSTCTPTTYLVGLDKEYFATIPSWIGHSNTPHLTPRLPIDADPARA